MTVYEGSEPYIFLSYAHKNTDEVMPIFEGLSDNGFRVWYDAGIEAGTEWPEYIAEHLEGASCLIAFMTSAFMDSSNCRQELNFAMELNIPILVIYLEDIKLTAGMRMRLGLTQAMYKTRHDSEESFFKALYAAKLLTPCRSTQNVPTTVNSPNKAQKSSVSPELPTLNQPFAQKEEPLEKAHTKSSASPKNASASKQTVSAPKQTAPKQTASAPKQTAAKQPTKQSPAVKYSVGLKFEHLAGNTFAVAGLGSCKDKDLIIPPPTPHGGRVTEIGREAFKGQQELTSVVIPEGVTKIGHSAFWNCTGLTSVTVPDSVKIIDSYAFIFCNSMSRLTLSSGVEKIESNAFSHCKSLVSIRLPEGLKFLGAVAFENCDQLESVTIPAGLTSMVDNPFANSNAIHTISVDARNSAYYSENNCVIEKATRKLVVGIKTSRIPENVTAIGDKAFYFCRELDSVTIPKTVTVIGRDAFCGCSGLSTITIPGSVKTLENGAFGYCDGIISVTIPAGVTSIGPNPFGSCTSLTSISVSSNNAYYYCRDNCLIERKTGKLITGTCNSRIPPEVTVIGERAFAGCDGLRSIVIPKGVTSIEFGAFDFCSSLESVVIPKSVKQVGSWAFSGCSKLTIYCEHASKPDTWDNYWNSSNSRVVWKHRQ